MVYTGHVRAGTFVQVSCLIGSDHFVSYSVFCVCGAASLCDLFPKRSDEEKRILVRRYGEAGRPPVSAIAANEGRQTF